MPTLYRVADWDALYENSRSRRVDNLQWVKIPNKHDSDGYTQLVDHPDGAAHYGCWVTIVQVASKCHPRGTLMRAGQQPHDARSLSRVTRLPVELYETALPRFVELDWLVAEIVEGQEVAADGGGHATPAWHLSDTRVTPECHPSAQEEKRREGKGKKEGKERKKGSASFDPLAIALPECLRTQEFQAAWKSWVAHRREIGKKLTPTSVDRQLKSLVQMGLRRAIAAIEHTIEKSWTGLREPEAGKPSLPSGRPDGRSYE